LLIAGENVMKDLALRKCGWLTAVACCVLGFATLPAMAQSPGDSPTKAGGAVEKSSTETANPAAAKLLDAYEKTKAAKTVEDWTVVIDLCDEGIKGATNNETTNYGKKLGSFARNRRGEEYAKSGNEQDAFGDFVAAAEMDATNWRALHNRGVSHAMAQRYDAALDDFNRALELHRTYANTWYNRGEIKYARGDFQGAIQDYSQAVRYNPQDPQAYNSRGHALYRVGRYREAISDFDRAVQFGPEDATAYNNRGDAYADQGFYTEAVRDYRQAIRLNPKLGRAYQSISWLMATCPEERYRDAQFALDAARKSIEIDGDKDYRYLDTLAAALANAGQYDEAVQTQEKAVAMAPAEDVARYRQRLDRDKEGKPYRDGPRSAATQSVREYR
jgi:tetratricopeptide (TPR) repeat protein